MADRTGKCVNFGLCSKADSREVIPVAGGAEFSCPECGKPLTETAGGAGGATGGKRPPSVGKAIAIGALGMVLVAGAGYKFLVAPDKHDDKSNNSQNVGVVNPEQPGNPQNPNGPITQNPNEPVPQNPNGLPPQNPNGPTTQTPSGPPPQMPNGVPPQNPNAPMTQTPNPSPGYPPAPARRPRTPGPRVSPAVDTTVTPPPPAQPPTPARDVAPPAFHGTMVARLLSPISTRNSNEGDPFQAKLENGPYRGQILSGVIKKLGKSKKSAELELEFTKLNGQPIPVKLDLTDIGNSQGVKGVDDENNRIEGQSSKKKMALVTGIGAGVGAGLGRLMGHSTKSTVIGGLAGAGAGYFLSVKVVSHAKEIELNAGSQLTLRESER